MSGDSRDAAARALLKLIGKGPGTTFPFPTEDYRNALVAVDALAEHLTERPLIGTQQQEK